MLSPNQFLQEYNVALLDPATRRVAADQLPLVNYADEVTVSQDTVAEPYRCYVLTGAGCTLTLPTTAIVGLPIFLRVDAAATEGLFQIKTEDGTVLDTYCATESVTYRRLVPGWMPQGAIRRAMRAAIGGASNDFQVFNPGPNDIRLPVEVYRVGPSLMTATANALVIPQAGTWSVKLSFPIKNTTTDGYYELLVKSSNSAIDPIIVNGTSSGYGIGSGSLPDAILPRLAVVNTGFYTTTSNVSTRSDNDQLLPRLSVFEHIF